MLLILSFLLLEPIAAAGSATPVAPAITLLTMGPGEFVWERYGHAAIEVDTPGLPAVCYNYGTFDFRKPVGLFWGILRAEPVFWVSRVPCEKFLQSYIRLDRTIYRQRIPLAPDRALALAAALETNARPENKHYVYHHFYDNCSTRPRDHLNRALGGILDKPAGGSLGPSFREMGRAGLADSPPLLLALDVFLGRGGDARPDLFGAAAVPDYLRQLVTERAGVPPEVLYARKGATPESTAPPEWQLWLVASLLLFIPAALTRAFRRAVRAGLFLSLLVPSLCGLILWLLAVVSSVAEFRFNEMILVFVPLDLALPFLSRRWQERYVRCRLGMLAGVLILRLVGVLHQPIVGGVAMVALPLLSAAFPRSGRSGDVAEKQRQGFEVIGT